MSLKKQILSGAFWTLAGQLGFMFVSLVANIIMARILTPYEFGQMGILMFFILVANIFTESGFGGALIRKVEINKEDYSTAFVFNFLISVLLFILLVCFSGIIARYYKDQALQKLIIVTGTILFINALSITPNAKLIREMQFKKRSIILFVSIILSAIISVFLAYYNWGIWSLIVFQLLTSAINSALLFMYGGLFFSLVFNKNSFKELYAFGVNTTIASALSAIFDNIYSLILGRYFSINQVGFYYQAKRLQTVPYNALNSVIQGVIFSSLAKLQEEKDRFISVYNKLMILFTIIMSSITILIFIYAESLIILLYGNKWAGAILFIKLLAIASFFYFQEQFNYVIFKVFNQTRKILYLEIIKKIIQILSIIFGIIKLDLKVLLYGFIVSSIISYGLNFYYSRKILGDNSRATVYALLKIIFISVISVIISKELFSYLSLNIIKTLYFLPLVILLFFFLLKTFKMISLIDEFKLLKSILKNYSKA